MIFQECRALAKESIYLVAWKHIMDVKYSYQVLYSSLCEFYFSTALHAGGEYLFGVLCLLETSVFGTSEDNT